MKRNRPGFTLIETLVVVALFAVVVGTLSQLLAYMLQERQREGSQRHHSSARRALERVAAESRQAVEVVSPPTTDLATTVQFRRKLVGADGTMREIYVLYRIKDEQLLRKWWAATAGSAEPANGTDAPSDVVVGSSLARLEARRLDADTLELTVTSTVPTTVRGDRPQGEAVTYSTRISRRPES